MESIEDRFIRHEGLRLKPYKDSKGIWTIGVGHNIEADKVMLKKLDYLKKHGITKDYALSLLKVDIAEHSKKLILAIKWIEKLDNARSLALLDMAFNMGIKGLQTFKFTLKLIQIGSYNIAANNIRKSKYAKDVGIRAEENAKIIETGELQEA